MNEEINAFGNGVTDGGLRNTTQIKILVEYLIDTLKEPITAENIVEALITHALANYFDASQAVSELIDKENIIKDDKDLLHITGKGQSALQTLIGDIPRSVRERALADALAIQVRLRNEGKNFATIEKYAEGYMVECSVMHNEIPLMKLSVYAADYQQAEDIKTSFLEDPAKLYSTAVSLLYK